jgi:hypothetical protein
MQFGNHHSESKCGACCPECAASTLHHCAHCPQHRETVAAQVPCGYDYSHLVGSPGKRHDNEFIAAQFDGLLTDYDRVWLGFGMHISSQ